MIYLMSKLIPLLIMPLGIALLLIVSRLFWRFRWSIPGAFFILYFFSIGAVSQELTRSLEGFWERKDSESVSKADAIVVLSGGGIYFRGPKASPVVEWGDPDRFLAGLQLYKKGKAPIIMFTGEQNTNSKTSGDIYIKEAIKLGVPPKALKTTSLVMNTQEEAIKVKKLLDQSKITSHKIILVTSAFHMIRAKRMFERNGMLVTPFPVDFKSNTAKRKKNPRDLILLWIPNAHNLAESSIAIREIIGRFVYR